MAKRDEVKVSDNFTKYLKFINSYEDGKYIAYEFEDQSGNLAIHYQIKPELLTDKKQIALARLFNTKMGKIKCGDICLTICKCREVLEDGFNQSVFYLNVDKVIKPLAKYEMVNQLYNGVPTEFVKEVPITSWEDITRNK